MRSSSYFVTTRPRRDRPSSFILSGASDSPLFFCPPLPLGRLPPLSLSSFLHIIVFLSSVTRSPDPLDLPLPFLFLGFRAFCRLPPLSLSPLSSSLPITIAEAPACQDCIKLGGGEVILGTLPGRAGSASDSSRFIGVALPFSTWFAQFQVVTSRANGVPTCFLAAGSTGRGLIVRSCVGVRGAAGGCNSGSGAFPLT